MLTLLILTGCATRKNKALQEAKNYSKVEVSSDIESSSVKTDKGVTVNASTTETVEEKPRIKQSVTVPIKNGVTVNKDSLGNEIKVTLDSLHKVLTIDVDFHGGYKKTFHTGVITDNRDIIESDRVQTKIDSVSVDKDYTKNEVTVTKKSPSIKFWAFIVIVVAVGLWILKKRVF